MRRLLALVLSALLAFSPLASAQTVSPPAGGGGGGTGANPTGTVGLATVNGSATTFLRSDGAPPLSQSIAPTWTAQHIWNPPVNTQAISITSGSVTSGTTGFGLNIAGTVNDASAVDGAAIFSNVTCTTCTATTFLMDLQVGGTSQFNVDSSGNIVSRLQMTSGSAVIVNNAGGIIGFQGGGVFSNNGAATLQYGNQDAASPSNQFHTIQNVATGTSNTAGINYTLEGSRSTGSGTSGDIIIQTGGTGAAATSQNAEVTALTIKGASQHVKYGSAAIPTVTSCGTGSPTVTAGSTDVDGEVTIGTTATACTITFKTAYAAAPFCVVVDKTVTANLTSYALATGTIILTMTSNSGNVVEWHCSGA